MEPLCRTETAKMRAKMGPGFDGVELFGALGSILIVFVQ